MKKCLMLFVVSGFLFADNEVYVDQVGATLNLDIEQLGSNNIIGGTDAVSGGMTALDLDGTTMTLDVNQIGDSNQFLGDICLSCSFLPLLVPSCYPFHHIYTLCMAEETYRQGRYKEHF